MLAKDQIRSVMGRRLQIRASQVDHQCPLSCSLDSDQSPSLRTLEIEVQAFDQWSEAEFVSQAQ